MRQLGVVKSFVDKRGYGFINVEGVDDDVFVHYSEIQMDGRKTLLEGQNVELTVEKTEKGLQAKAVVVI